MTDRARELEEVASRISMESLDASRRAIAYGCGEYTRWAELFIQRLKMVEPGELHKFARALFLTLLGHLPTRPESCPFCIQYGHSQSCQGCGYGLTHGRCDSEHSSFSLFIEAFCELGKAVYQDTGELSCPADEACRRLYTCIHDSIRLAEKMNEDLLSLSTQKLMERKACYLDQMIGLLPVELFGPEAYRKRLVVHETLVNYW